MANLLLEQIFFNIETIKLDYQINELTVSQIKDHTPTARGGLFVRRAGRVGTNTALGGVIAASLGSATNSGDISFSTGSVLAASAGMLFGLLNSLIEAGIIPTTEKFAFIRFQGLADIHAKRLNAILKTNKYTTAIAKARKPIIKLRDDISLDKAQKLYSEMISTESSIIAEGYIKILETSDESPNSIKEIKRNFLKLKMSFDQGKTIWHRAEAFLSSGIFASIMPLFSFISHLQQLDKKSPKLHLIQNTQKKLNKII